MKTALIAIASLALGVGATLALVSSRTAGPQAGAVAGACAEHGVPAGNCPWCDPGLIESKGQCLGHGVPEAFCSRCDPSLIPGFKAVNDWCAGHGVPESQCAICLGEAPPAQASGPVCGDHQVPEANCPWCDPGLIDARGACPEHGVPLALCSVCNPALIPGFREEFDWCSEHEVPESLCGLCDPSLSPALGRPTPAPPSAVALVPRELPRNARAPSSNCSTETLRVQFRSAQVADDAGLEFATVVEREVATLLSCTAEVEYDRNRYAHVVARSAGVVQAVHKDLGDEVEAGELLAVVASTELGAAKTDLLQARSLAELWERNSARERRLAQQRVSTERDLLQAETELAKSRVAVSGATQRLRNLGLSEAEIAVVCSSQDTSTSLEVVAPFAGTVVARHAVIGEVLRTDSVLFGLANTRSLWAMLDVQESDIPRVKPGQPVLLTVAGIPGEAFPGALTWVSTELDRRTRTLRARADLSNHRGVLRAGMFGRAVVEVHAAEPRLVVPKSAVQWEGCCNVVFVRKSDVLFEPRKIRLGIEVGQQWVVEGGLSEGEVVVTTGSFLLKTEILKGSIGAGCCEAGPGAH